MKELVLVLVVGVLLGRLSVGTTTTPQGDHVITRKSALNMVDGRFYPHHPVFQQVHPITVPVHPHHLVEFTGLKIPRHLDCQKTGKYDYYHAVPSRWVSCNQHEEAVKSGWPLYTPSLPTFDDEYQEAAAIYDMVMKKKEGRLVVVEMGARWGTWGFRAAAMNRAFGHHLPHELLFVESDPHSCEWIH